MLGRGLTIATLVGSVGCGGISESKEGSSSGSGGSAGTAGQATGGRGGDASGGTGTGGSVAGTGGTCAPTGGTSGGSRGGTAGGVGEGGGGFTKRGICGQRSTATVTSSVYEGFEEFYLITEEAIDDERLDELACLVRFQVTRVGDAPPGCADPEGTPCIWTYRVALTNPEIVTNVDDACSNNELAWNREWMDEVDGSRPAYGLLEAYTHDNVLMRYEEPACATGTGTWDVFGRAQWSSDTGDLTTDSRYGRCRY